MELRVVLLGKTGNGKSSLGNTLLGREAFRVARGMSSGTDKCQWADTELDDTILSVTDTPGLCDTHRNEDDIFLEVGKSVAVACPGPHAVIIVLRCDRRFTQEEYDSVQTLKSLFGDKLSRHLIIVFAGGDDLRVPPEQMQQALEDRLKNAPEQLKEILSDANNRYCAVDNTASAGERAEHARHVLDLIKRLVDENNGRYFTNDMVKEYSEAVQSVVLQQQQLEGVSCEEARNQMRKAVVSGNANAGFLDTLRSLSKKYILPALRVIGSFVVGVATEAILKARCSLM